MPPPSCGSSTPFSPSRPPKGSGGSANGGEPRLKLLWGLDQDSAPQHRHHLYGEHFRDIYIPHPQGTGTTQIDHVVASTAAIFVIETKNFRGGFPRPSRSSSIRSHSVPPGISRR